MRLDRLLCLCKIKLAIVIKESVQRLQHLNMRILKQEREREGGRRVSHVWHGAR